MFQRIKIYVPDALGRDCMCITSINPLDRLPKRSASRADQTRRSVVAREDEGKFLHSVDLCLRIYCLRLPLFVSRRELCRYSVEFRD